MNRDSSWYQYFLFKGDSRSEIVDVSGTERGLLRFAKPNRLTNGVTSTEMELLLSKAMSTRKGDVDLYSQATVSFE